MSHVRLFLEPGTWNLEPGIQRGRWAAVFLRLCFPGSLMSFPEGRAFAERKRVVRDGVLDGAAAFPGF